MKKFCSANACFYSTVLSDRGSPASAGNRRQRAHGTAHGRTAVGTGTSARHGQPDPRAKKSSNLRREVRTRTPNKRKPCIPGGERCAIRWRCGGRRALHRATRGPRPPHRARRGRGAALALGFERASHRRRYDAFSDLVAHINDPGARRVASPSEGLAASAGLVASAASLDESLGASRGAAALAAGGGGSFLLA